jgi:hypothetical protein
MGAADLISKPLGRPAPRAPATAPHPPRPPAKLGPTTVTTVRKPSTMDMTTFIRTADELIDRLAPRIDHRQAGFVRGDARAGEWGEALDNLIACLIREHIPIAPDDEADLRALLAYMRQPASRLDGITVAASMAVSVDQATAERFGRVALPAESTADVVLRAALVGLEHLENHRAVREILWAWDPIGVAGDAPVDEYDALIGPVVGVLSGGADQPALTAWLCERAENYFGLSRPASSDAESATAERLLAWWTTRLRSVVPYPHPRLISRAPDSRPAWSQAKMVLARGPWWVQKVGLPRASPGSCWPALRCRPARPPRPAGLRLRRGAVSIASSIRIVAIAWSIASVSAGRAPTTTRAPSGSLSVIRTNRDIGESVSGRSIAATVSRTGTGASSVTSDTHVSNSVERPGGRSRRRWSCAAGRAEATAGVGARPAPVHLGEPADPGRHRISTCSTPAA